MGEFKVMKAKEIAQRYGKSISWVYANGHYLGGAKIGGAWIFEEKEVEDALSRGQAMARQRHGGQAAEDKVVRHQKGGKGLGSIRKEEAEIWGADTDPGRHGIANFLQSLLGLCGSDVCKENVYGEEGAGSKSLR